MGASPKTLVLSGTVAVALLGGTLAFVAYDKTVTLSVDGEQREVRSFARTVEGVLDNQGIRVGSHDVVAPALDAKVSEGGQITVRYARPLNVVIDGSPREVWVTARSVSEALNQLGVRDSSTWVSASRSMPIGRAGLSLEVRRPHTVTFVADGRARRITTTASTVQAAAAEAGLSVGPADRVSVPVTAYPADGSQIKITRVVTKVTVVKRKVPFRTVTRSSSALYEGDTKIATKGVDGLRTLTYRQTIVDGRLASNALIRTAETVRRVDKVVLSGTKERPVASSGSSGSSVGPTADGLNWAALARCESGGNPRAVNSAGPYYGLYQFLPSTWRSVGGSGLPSQASPAEQTARAQILYRRSGAGQWPVCGRLL